MKKILIIGGDPTDALLLTTLKEKHGDDIILFTPEQAKEQGLKMEDFGNLPTMKITAPEIITPAILHYKTGQENRRERRKMERNKTKLK